MFTTVLQPEDWNSLRNSSTGIKEWVRTWNDYHHDARELARKLHEKGVKFGLAIAIARGGQILATILERELNIREAVSLPVKSYDHTNQSPAKILIPLGSELIAEINAGKYGKDILIVDDLTDTGATARLVLEEYLKPLCPGINFHFVALYVKPKGKEWVDAYVTEVPQDVWILQPFDTEYVKSPPLEGDFN